MNCFSLCSDIFTTDRNRETLINDIFTAGVQMDRGDDDGSHCCLVAIGRLQVTSTPNSTDLMGNNSEFISRHSVDGKFTFVDQRY